MAVDTPATIAIVGAGPIGIEAALYARYLGYDVVVFDQGEVGHHLRQWGDVRLFTPFEMNSTPLGLAALRAQSPELQRPEPEAILTGQQWLDGYLLPLAESDLLAGSIRCNTQVLSLGRSHLHKSDAIGDPDLRGDGDFRLLLCDEHGESSFDADIVIDASGSYSQARWLGAGGMPAVGERQLRANGQIQTNIPAADKCSQYVGKHTAVIGSGYSAATTMCRIMAMIAENPGTHISWIVRQEIDQPIQTIKNDRLIERAQLAESANQAAMSAHVDFMPGVSVSQIETTDGQFTLQLHGKEDSAITVDHIIANVGYRPDTTLFEELQVHLCYATSGPMKLAASLLKTQSEDCLDQSSAGSVTLLNPEPDFYILGAKSYGRNSSFLLSVGHQQIRELFSVIGDRADLDLYANARI